MAKTNYQDGLAKATNTPDIGQLLFEYNDSLYTGSNIDRLAAIEDIRFCRWAGQSDDGKKHSEGRDDGNPAMPFEGASDVRNRLVDRTINDLSALLVTSFTRSTLRVSGVGFEDSEKASRATTLMRWLLEGRNFKQIYEEAYLGAQYAYTYGWTVYHVGWEQQMSKRTQPITMNDIRTIAQMAAQENPASPVATLPEMIASGDSDNYVASIITATVTDASEKDALRMVKELREKGESSMEETYISKNSPSITALKPYDEISFPPETVDIQRARVIFRRTFMTEVEVRSMRASDNWNASFIEKAVSTIGKASLYNDPTITPITATLQTNVHRTRNMIEIVYAYARQIDSNGIPAIYYTVFCPQVAEGDFAKHEILDYYHGEYPFIGYKAEQHCRRAITESRGIPEISRTDQDEIKAQHDALRDRTAFETLPPIKVAKRIGALNRIGPAVMLPVSNKDDYVFMEPPAGNPQVAFSLIERVEANHAAYYGLTSKYVEDVRSQLIQQNRVNNWLLCWTEIYRQTFQLALQYLTPEEKTKIVGADLPARATEIHGMQDFILKFDVREVDTNLVLEKLDAIVKFAVPLDAQGIIDRSKLVKVALDAIHPDAAKELIVDSEQASQKMFRDIQTDIALMMAGNQPSLTEGDPAAQTKLQLVQQIMQQNAKAQQSLQGDEQFQMAFQQYVQNLQMSVSQEQNKQVGRTGVAPQGQSFSQQVSEIIKQAQAAQQAPEQEMAPESGMPPEGGGQMSPEEQMMMEQMAAQGGMPQQ
jgi:hypothetical protein